MIARRFILLVGHILFLVKDDAPDVSRRSKERGTRADDDPCLPAPHAKNRVIALGDRKLAVQDDDVARKYLLKRCNELPRKSNLRHEHNNLSSCGTHGTRRLNINARLTAARHAMQQAALKSALRNRCMEFRNSRCLRRRQGIRTGGRGARSVTVTCAAPQMLGQNPCIDEMLDGRRRNARLFQRRARMLPRLPKKRECPRLCGPARERRQRFVGDLPCCVILLIARLIAFIGVVFFAQEMVAQEFFNALLHRSGR